MCRGRAEAARLDAQAANHLAANVTYLAKTANAHRLAAAALEKALRFK
jgi:hypothetical protein